MTMAKSELSTRFKTSNRHANTGTSQYCHRVHNRWSPLFTEFEVTAFYIKPTKRQHTTHPSLKASMRIDVHVLHSYPLVYIVIIRSLFYPLRRSVSLIMTYQIATSKISLFLSLSLSLSCSLFLSLQIDVSNRYDQDHARLCDIIWNACRKVDEP